MKICVYQNKTSGKLLLLVYISKQNGNTILVDLIDNEIKEILSDIPKYDEILIYLMKHTNVAIN